MEYLQFENPDFNVENFASNIEQLFESFINDSINYELFRYDKLYIDDMIKYYKHLIETIPEQFDYPDYDEDIVRL